MQSFRLEKWYLDAVDKSGNAIIAYSAKVTWGLIMLNYNGFIFYQPGLPAIKRNSFTAKNFPFVDGNKVVWNFGTYRGIWQREDQPIQETLLKHAGGEIVWACEHPKATAFICVDSKLISGAGYAEKILITIPPWKIPIKELHWGRFLSDKYTVIWIKWIGPIPKSIVFCNGDRRTPTVVTSNSVVFDDLQLRLENSKTLRKGTVLSNVFARFKSIQRLFPETAMMLDENKWLSDGILSKGGEKVAMGNAIHEIVKWP